MKATNFEIRKHQITAKVKQSFSVLYLSDFHFNAYSQAVAHWILEQVDKLKPDIILLGGDYVDTSKGLPVLEALLKGIASTSNCFAVAGNHDYFFGIEKIKSRLIKHGIKWIENDSTLIQLGATPIRINGNQIHSPISTGYDFSILCTHNPKVLNGDLSSYQLAFAGHLHGSQVVLWQNIRGLFPGKLFYKWNILGKRIKDCTCYISKGLGDTLPIRFNCKKDIIFVEVQPGSYN